MIYKRKDLIGQEETFEGDTIEIMGMIKLLEINQRGGIEAEVDEDGMYLIIDGEEDRDG